MYKAANDFVGILKNIEADPDLIKKVAKKLEDRLGLTLTRDEGLDWKTGLPTDNMPGTTYDELISRTPSRYFDDQWDDGIIQKQIENHITKADHPVIDFEGSDLSSEQIDTIKSYISTNGYTQFIYIE